ncbi:Hypothetical predicted protein [Octopus vulgaris]|uniref:Uncharacterized protein n=1 Tax=Octopus vulgaris TaxID=6645 RepID=A0AA36EXE3_OCTVU|nr:Hypothetical predicted protein [Octopus vulgaris]
MPRFKYLNNLTRPTSQCAYIDSADSENWERDVGGDMERRDVIQHLKRRFYSKGLWNSYAPADGYSWHHSTFPLCFNNFFDS